MTAKTNQQRQAAFKERMRAAGFDRVDVWVHPEDRTRLKNYVKRLQSARIKQQEGA